MIAANNHEDISRVIKDVSDGISDVLSIANIETKRLLIFIKKQSLHSLVHRICNIQFEPNPHLSGY